jgi:hypothetical protein
MLPGFTARYSLFRTKHLYRGGSSSWDASETADLYGSDRHAAVSSADHVADGLVVPARTFGPPPHCTTECECSDGCNLNCTTTCIPGGTKTTTESCCALGGSCENGSCVCPPPLRLCGTTPGHGCTNVETDLNNCGFCGNVCPVGGSCSNGSCVCPTGQTNCNGVCVDLNDNCGTCGNVCTGGTTCQNGQCVCPNGQPLNTSANCSSCGDQCPSGASCISGMCRFGVPAHVSSPATSVQCGNCESACGSATPACMLAAFLACAPSLDVPIIGGALYLACTLAATEGCFALESTCVNNCSNIGSPCCPVGCGPSCCLSNESCSDIGEGLCCSAGTTPCGTMCCQGNEACMEGQCCPVGSTVCPDGTCCDNVCNQCQGGACLPVADGTQCETGSCCNGQCCSGSCIQSTCVPTVNH